MLESNPRWMTRIGLVLIILSLIRNLVFVLSSFQVEQILVENTNVRIVAHVLSVLGMLFLLPELRTRLAPLLSLFLITKLPLFSFSDQGSAGNLILALLILMIGVACIVYSVGGSARLYFIVGCLSSWLFALASLVSEVRQSSNVKERIVQDAVQVLFALSLGLAAMMIQRFVTQLMMLKQPKEEQPINNS